MGIAGNQGERMDMSLEDLVVDRADDRSSESDYENIIKEANRYWHNVVSVFNKTCPENGHWDTAMRLGACAKIANPEKAGQLELDDKKWEEMKKIYEKYYKANNYFEAAQAAVDLLILYPSKVEELGLEDKKPKMKENYRLLHQSNFRPNFLQMGMYLAYLYPEEASHLELGSREKRSVKDAYTMIVRNLDIKGRNTCELVKACKYLGLFDGDVDLIEIMKQDMRDQYQEVKLDNARTLEEDTIRLVNAILALRYLEAQEIRRTSRGIEFVESNESYDGEVEPRPERISK